MMASLLSSSKTASVGHQVAQGDGLSNAVDLEVKVVVDIGNSQGMECRPV